MVWIGNSPQARMVKVWSLAGDATLGSDGTFEEVRYSGGKRATAAMPLKTIPCPQSSRYLSRTHLFAGILE